MSKKYKVSNWAPNYPMYAIKRNINVVIPIRLQYTKFVDFVRVTEDQLKRIFHPVSITQCRVSTSMCTSVQAFDGKASSPDDGYWCIHDFNFYISFDNELKFYKHYTSDDFKKEHQIFWKRMELLEKIVYMADKGRLTPDVLR